jgi:cyclophilin family peptidyl-prolyl cis-trans isomerase
VRRVRTRGLALQVAGSLLLAGCAHRSPLLAPRPRALARAAPDSFLVELLTNRGMVLLGLHRDWSPLGVDRVHFLVGRHYYDGARFFRMVPGFVVQWGISGDPAVNAAWKGRLLGDEPVRRSNTRGRLAFARGGPNTRGTQLYINLADNPRLDTTSSFGFPPLGEVLQGMPVLDSLFAGYSCRRGSQGTCPPQDSIQAGGTQFLSRVYPKLDYIVRARIRRW